MASKTQSHFVESLPGVFVQDSFSKFLVLKLKDGSSFRDQNAFHVTRDIVKVCGSIPKIVPQADGSLLVEARDAEESATIEAINRLASCDVSVVGHATLNQSRGVVYCKDLLRYSEEELLDGLKDQGVVRVERIRKKVDGVLTATPSIIVTFDRLTLPDVLQAAYYRLRVKPYVPRPRRCFHCQRFGHVGKSCRRQQQGLPQICVQCGEATHGEGVVCPNPPSCLNCRGAHPASSIQCDHYKFEFEVLSVRARERLSFAEAKEKVRGLFLRPGVTFASVLSRRPAVPQQGVSQSVLPQTSRGGGCCCGCFWGAGCSPPYGNPTQGWWCSPSARLCSRAEGWSFGQGGDAGEGTHWSATCVLRA